MNKRPILYSKQERKQIIELSPRFTKRAEHLGREVLGKVSAQTKLRKPEAKPIRLSSPFSLHSKFELKKINEAKHVLTEEEIRNSSTYRMCEERLKKETRKLEEEIQRLRKIKEDRQKEYDLLSKDQFNTKLQIWESKNRVLAIKGDIQAEESEIENLVEQLRPYDSEDEGEQELPDERHDDNGELGEQLDRNRDSN